jgi:CRISPR-associated protein Csb2
VVFSIEARYPLGTYRGNTPDQRIEPMPTPARLHSALLCAAGFGPRAVEQTGTDDDGWGPCAADEPALRWLEEHPPTDVRIPQLRISRTDAIAYRDDGTIGKAKGGKQIRKLPKQDAAVAVDGPFVWMWREEPPAVVVEALRALCADVPHLGTAESPVVLTVEAHQGDGPAPTHRYASDAGRFDRQPGLSLDVPTAGRVAELRQAHRAERTTRVRGEKPGTDERSRSAAPPRAAVRPGRYRSVARPVAVVPWSEVLLVPLDRSVAERDRVRVAVAAHKAMIKHLDRGSPSMLTGAYPDGVRRPVNRVALQVLDASYPVALPGGAPSALAVLLPRDAEPSAAAAVYEAVGALRTLHPVGQVMLRVEGQVEVRAGDQVWREPAAGMVRLWRTCPAAVPDTRGRDGWTFTHAALLSLGFVWQGTAIPVPRGRGAERDGALVDSVNAAGVVVLRARPVRASRPEEFAHHVHADAVVRPYRATLALGDLGTPRTIQAIGQSRHLGGGLLVPHDLPEHSSLDTDVPGGWS